MMTYKELAGKITGISFPFFGISWTPIKPDIEIARKVINFLENKRVLFNSYELENPNYCMKSVIQIRDFLTTQLDEVNRGSELDGILRGMRSAGKRVMDTGAHNYQFGENNSNSFGPLDQIVFFSQLGIFRGILGMLIAKLVIMHGLEIEDDLISILPVESFEIS
jgi:hypothetical protein